MFSVCFGEAVAWLNILLERGSGELTSAGKLLTDAEDNAFRSTGGSWLLFGRDMKAAYACELTQAVTFIDNVQMIVNVSAHQTLTQHGLCGTMYCLKNRLSSQTSICSL